MCLSRDGDKVSGFKSNLPLLAMCPLWRRLAIPLVYDHVFVQYEGRPTRSGGLFTVDPNVTEPTDVAVKTNLGLVAMAGCAHAVKRVRIDVHCLANPFPGWREVIQRMHDVASTWGVVDLTVEMHPDLFHFDARNLDMDKYTDDVAEVGDLLAALMPDVRRLECGGVNQNPIARTLYGRLAGHYADQLQKLISQHPIAVPVGSRFTKLQKVEVSYDYVAGYQLPQIQSEELVDMSLTNGPPNHSWASFSTDGDPRAIEFTKLTNLHAAYGKTYEDNGAAVHHRDGHPWKLCFPSLENLDIHCMQDTCPLLEYAVLPPRMESISIKLKAAAYQEIANVVLPVTQCIALGIAVQAPSDLDGFPVINRILDRVRGSEVLKLKIEDSAIPVVPESITCTTLTHLKVLPPTTVDTMLAFIERLPNLAKLSLYGLDVSEIQADMSIPDADHNTLVEPIHASLSQLIIYGHRMRHYPDKAVAVAKYMLLRVPTLTTLIAIYTPKTPVLNFVDAYAPRHPNLSSVQLTLDEGKHTGNH
ncbi:hypothetical protein H4R21_001032 [Coemansia helicoidea]|uniref:Uncharacterized protein n=1 Tax=Coemansia helicoidea TaxID=1286919 RepID=A0ACC1LED1_9FUNG|nr:hypothetical protein H4R21_001032 [Coemansia helicoidea]